MIVLDAATAWILGGAAAGVVLVAALVRQRVRQRRMRGEIRMVTDSTLTMRSVSGPASVQPTPSRAPWSDSRPAAGVTAAAAAALPQRRPDAIRAEIAAHAERLAAARAARSAQHAAAAAAANPAPAVPASAGEPAAELPRQVFDPTRSTPWQQVVESVARARYDAPAPAAAAASPAGRVVPISAAMNAASLATVNAAQVAIHNARTAPSKRVLVADDARVVRVKLQRLLASQGWDVIEAADGDEALRLLGSERPDLLITDVDMPGLDGFALTRAVRAAPASASLPVIMITAADDEHREEASRAGVTMLLGKPYGEAALLAHMRRLMGLKPATPVVTVTAAASVDDATVAETAAA